MSDSPTDLLRRLARVTPLAWGPVVVATATSAIATIALLAQATAIARVVGGLFASRHADLRAAIVDLALASLVRALATAAGAMIAGRLAAPVRRDLRRRVLEATLARGPRCSIDATVQLATRGVEAIEAYLTRYVTALAASVVGPAILVTWLVTRDWLSGVIVALCVALLPIFMALLGAEAKAKMLAGWQEQQRLAGYFGDVVRGMATLKAFNRSRDALNSLERVGRRVRETTMATLRVAFLSSFALELLSSLATALVALFLGVRLLHGGLALSNAVAILVVTPEVFLPLRRVAAAYHASATGVAATEDVLDLLVNDLRGLDAPSISPGVALGDVAVAPGGLLLVTGASGIGKSTLLRQLCTLEDPPEGKVHIDGIDLAHLDRDQWRSRVAWLAQDPRVTGSSLREAVTLGDPSVGDDEVRAALTLVGLGEDLDRPVGEGARALSAGERRRLGLARCLMRHPLVLVLDEPLAHLDPRGADELASVIANLSMTRVVASHRPLRADAVLDLKGHA
ncbi:MAG TPA: ATP-binding cassette domain-containing protein [Acidimicrobiales bacterium]|nr:ATP-binding cassette domain-containing protein [Acidimicrobiales bacterium]